MKALFVLVSMIAASQPVMAGCTDGESDEVLSVESWAVDVSPDRAGMMTERTEIELLNHGRQAIQMIEGAIVFEDALGGYIARISIERDLQVGAGDLVSWEAEFGGTGLDRVANLDTSQVVVTACVARFLYADGTKEEF